MVSFKAIVLFVLGLSFLVFVTFFGRLPALRNTPIATLHRLIWVRAPNALLALDQRLTSGRLTKTLSRFGNYIMFDRHPTVVILFAAIMLVGEYLYLPAVWPRVGWFTKLSAGVTVILPYVFLYLSCASDPGYVTPETHTYYMSLYPYDHGLFHPGRECSSCNLLKPARSKHCSTCKRCVAKSDHHCIFINSCVGYGNQHWFLLLLLSTAVLTTYGAVLGLSLLTTAMKSRFPSWLIWKPAAMSYNHYFIIWGWGIHQSTALGGTTLLALMTTPLVWGLLFYTLWLVYCGTTTNETLKWSEWKEDMADGYAFRRHLLANRQKNARTEPPCPRWPVEPLQILACTTDGKPPRSNAPMHGQGEWEHVWSLKSVENLYDLGLWDNLADIFVSDYKFGLDRRQVLKWRSRHSSSGERWAYPP